MCHVLIIEDDWIIAENIADIAREAGATSIATADSQQAGIDAALARPPAVILSDVQLATGTGPLAVQAIREQLGPMPVIFVTGTPEACVDCDYAEAILEKPVAAAEVISAFRRIAPIRS